MNASVADLSSDAVESARLLTTTSLPSGVTRAIHGSRPTRVCARTVRDAQSISVTVPDPEDATYACEPSGAKSIAYGCDPVGIRATTRPRRASRTQAYPPEVLTPQISSRLGFARIPLGEGPTGMVASARSVTRFIAVSVPSAVLLTYAKRCRPGRRKDGR